MKKVLWLGFFLVSNLALAETINLKLTAVDLKISGEFPFREEKGLSITGVDQKNLPYTLTVQTQKQENQFLETTYSLNRDGQVQGGTILQKKGKKASITSGPSDHKELSTSFEVLIKN